jgi:ATP-dependent DNA helicase DinG
MSTIEKYLGSEVAGQMREEIDKARGHEVFFTGFISERVVNEFKVIARGHETAVPAVLKIARQADVVIHNHPSGDLTPSDADLAIATSLDTFSVAFYIVDNAVKKIYVVIEPFDKEEIKPLDAVRIENDLKPGGVISQSLPGYEDRPQQIEMIHFVTQAFNENKVTMIEAGTGTGKTMAYLLPAIHWSLQNKERIVISTNTINLQEQIIQKDIPFLQNVLTEKFEAVLVKGRGNYACLRKVDELYSDMDLLADEDERTELLNLVEWARHSHDGSKSDLSYIPKEDIWEKVAAESDTCLRNKCHHFRGCYVNKARRKASQANILVVNHHLLLADLAIRHQMESADDVAVLPPYQRIIFDEAHHLEEVATHYFGSQITRTGIIRILHRLHRQHRGIYKGYLQNLRNKIYGMKAGHPDPIFDKILEMLDDQLIPEIMALLDKTDFIMDNLYMTVESTLDKKIQEEQKIRLLPHVVDRLFHASGLTPELQEFVQSCKFLSGRINTLLDSILTLQKYSEQDLGFITIEIKAQGDRLAEAGQIVHDVIFNNDEHEIRWLEIKPTFRGKNIIRFLKSPLTVDRMMQTAVYDIYDTIIMTSATLAVDQNFDFIASRLGIQHIENERKTNLIVPAPFNFKEQVILAVPVDMPEPNHHEFSSDLANVIFKALTISEGRAFVLFTSYGLLNIVYNKINESLGMIGIRALKQGTVNRHELLRQFKADKTSVLFATDSFWEGVDVIGDALESVIITKLPFKVPNEPVIEARYEAIERDGGNAFMEYAVPMAVIKFKQGFGRLIRSKTDRGCVIILDNRVVQKNYGQRFMRSLPDCHLAVGKREQVFTELKQFFSR